MQTVLGEILGWLAFLNRSSVLLQLLPLLAMALALVQLRRLPVQPRLRLLWRLPLSVLLLLGELLIAFLLGVSGQRLGLVLLSLQISAIWLALRLLETQLLARWLSPAARQLLVSRLIRPLYLVYVGLGLLDALGSLQDMASASLGVWFGSEISLGLLSQVLLVLYLLSAALELPALWVSRLLQRGLSLSEGSCRALEQILRYVLFALGVIWALARLGVNQTGVLAVAGGLSVGLGFGIKEVFSNFVSGLWLLFEGSVRPGEVLMIDGDPCEVRRLGLRATLLWRDRDNAELLIPNQTFFTDTATTYTATDRLRRSQVSVGAAYRHDPAQVIALLEATALKVPRVLRQPPPKGLLLSYGDSAINYSLRFWIANPMDNVGICSEVNQAIWTAFAEAGIEIPYPQQVQHVIGSPPSEPRA